MAYVWQLTGKDIFLGNEIVFLTLETDDQNVSVPPVWDGIAAVALDLINREISATGGVYGHILDPKTITPADFSYYLSQSKFLEGELVEGVIDEYDPGFGDDVQT